MGCWKEELSKFVRDNPVPNSQANGERKEMVRALVGAPDTPELWLNYLDFEEKLRDKSSAANGLHTTTSIGANTATGRTTNTVVRTMTVERLYRSAYGLVKDKSSEAAWTMGIRLGRIRWERDDDEGRQHFEALQWNCPQYLPMYREWAKLEYHSGNKSKALKVFRRVVKAGAKLTSELEHLKQQMEDDTLMTDMGTSGQENTSSKMEIQPAPATTNKQGNDSPQMDFSEQTGNDRSENRENQGTSMDFAFSTPQANVSFRNAGGGSSVPKSTPATKYGPPLRRIAYSSSSSSSGSSISGASDVKNGQKRKERDSAEDVDVSQAAVHSKKPARCLPEKGDSTIQQVPSTLGVSLESTQVSFPKTLLDRRPLQDSSLGQNLAEGSTISKEFPGGNQPTEKCQTEGTGLPKNKVKGSNVISQLPTIPEEDREKSTSPKPQNRNSSVQVEIELEKGGRGGGKENDRAEKKPPLKEIDRRNDGADRGVSMPPPTETGGGMKELDPRTLRPERREGSMTHASRASSNASGDVKKTQSSRSSGQSSKEHIMLTGTPKENDTMVVVRGRVYEKLGALGKGGSSRVFKVRLVDRARKGVATHNLTFALKRCEIGTSNKDIAQGYKAEVDILRKLMGKPGILQLKDWQIWEGPGIIFMLLEEGETDLQRLLASHVQQRQSFGYTSPDWLFIRMRWAEMLEAVRVLHDARVIHSDLKPANFLMVKGHLKLIDFGIARPMANDSTAIFRETLIGTVSYMAPEALQSGNPNWTAQPDSQKVSRPSDIWSLGIILYQMVYGTTPFQSVSGSKKMTAILDEKWEIPFPSADVDCVDVMRRCLTRDPSKRITMEELMSHPFVNLNQKREKSVVQSEGAMPSPLGKEKLRMALEQVFGKSAELSTMSQTLLGVLKKENVGLTELSSEPNPRSVEERSTMALTTGCPNEIEGNHGKPSTGQNCMKNDVAKEKENRGNPP
ncbi:hypothetical protein BSKO_08750 [Bryopsis sp. KO-2023]|nr:hypothetical protein BSKO_08750 [Bryopsis sp. KO-2023]